MHRYIINIIICTFQCCRFPFRECRHIKSRTSAGYQLDRRIDQFHCFCCLFCKTSVLFHCLVSELPRSIHLITQTPYFDIMWIFYTMFDTKITIFCSARMVAVFQKIAGICNSSCTKIDCHHHVGIYFVCPFCELI